MCRLHFYNTPITDDFTEASHPLNIIRSICEPGDFIVVKLDIDNAPLETAIMAEIGADPELHHCINEMFYEQHYDHAGAELLRCLRVRESTDCTTLSISTYASHTNCQGRQSAQVRVCLQTWLMSLAIIMAQSSRMSSKPSPKRGNLDSSYITGRDCGLDKR